MQLNCSKCGRSISKFSKSPFCRWCENPKWTNEKSRPNSLKHERLKQIASDFLLSLGCTTIKTESRSLSGSSRFIYDVVGIRESQIFIVECGWSKHNKLTKIIESGYILYILPYGYDKPFLYQKETHICHVCGNKI